MNKILFVVENDYFPRDARVYNEAISLANNGYKCFVIAPRQKHEKFFEVVEDKIICYRFPHFEAQRLSLLVIEYFNAFFWITFFSFYLSIIKNIRIIHVANPPDLIIPLLSPLKLLSVKLIFDVHDLSVETLNAKNIYGNIFSIVKLALSFFEKVSVKWSDVVISTNTSIKSYLFDKYGAHKNFVIRNSNNIIYNSINEIKKEYSRKYRIGYFGIISDDSASGFENIVYLAELLRNNNFSFIMDIIGDGPGLKKLEGLVKRKELDDYFIFRGFLDLQSSFNVIKNFDFGIVPWPDIPKNNLHTAMKIMDYMCCGVPVCSLKLKEQIISTNGIGLHVDSFKEMAIEIIKVCENKEKHQELRTLTLNHFNNHISWEIQEQKLLACYYNLLNKSPYAK